MQPFLKWAGGKRWLFSDEFLTSLPKYKRYIEPFLGGGAGFFAIEPKAAFLSDINKELINLYKVLRRAPNALQKTLSEHQKNHSKEYYYFIRGSNPTSPIQSAARTLYLNRTCWNGLYRLNTNGKFNVPIGTKNAVISPTDDFLALSKLLRRAKIQSCDFELTLDQATKGDLIFADPPYTVKHNMNGFIKYNESIFQWSDQVRLRDALLQASKRGALVLLTNADHPSVRELYKGFGDHCRIHRNSVISGVSYGRSEVTELMVRT